MSRIVGGTDFGKIPPFLQIRENDIRRRIPIGIHEFRDFRFKRVEFCKSGSGNLNVAALAQHRMQRVITFLCKCTVLLRAADAVQCYADLLDFFGGINADRNGVTRDESFCNIIG